MSCAHPACLWRATHTVDGALACREHMLAAIHDLRDGQSLHIAPLPAPQEIPA